MSHSGDTSKEPGQEGRVRSKTCSRDEGPFGGQDRDVFLSVAPIHGAACCCADFGMRKFVLLRSIDSPRLHLQGSILAASNASEEWFAFLAPRLPLPSQSCGHDFLSEMLPLKSETEPARRALRRSASGPGRSTCASCRRADLGGGIISLQRLVTCHAGNETLSESKTVRQDAGER